MGLTYYVRTDGNDSNNGLGANVNQAFQTISHAVNTACDNNQSDNKIWIAPGNYNYEYIVTYGEEFFNNLAIEGNSDGTIFGVEKGLIHNIEMMQLNCGNYENNTITIKNIVITYSLVVNNWYETLNNNVTLINVLLKEGAFELNVDNNNLITFTAINCSTASGMGNFNAGNGNVYNCAITSSFNVGLVNMYNCMCPTVNSLEGSNIVNHIYEYPQFVDKDNNDFHLIDGNIGIDSGMVVEGYSPDIYGNVRPQGTAPDRGVAESIANPTMTIVQCVAISFYHVEVI